MLFNTHTHTHTPCFLVISFIHSENECLAVSPVSVSVSDSLSHSVSQSVGKRLSWRCSYAPCARALAQLSVLWVRCGRGFRCARCSVILVLCQRIVVAKTGVRRPPERLRQTVSHSLTKSRGEKKKKLKRKKGGEKIIEKLQSSSNFPVCVCLYCFQIFNQFDSNLFRLICLPLSLSLAFSQFYAPSALFWFQFKMLYEFFFRFRFCFCFSWIPLRLNWICRTHFLLCALFSLLYRHIYYIYMCIWYISDPVTLHKTGGR